MREDDEFGQFLQKLKSASAEERLEGMKGIVALTKGSSAREQRRMVSLGIVDSVLQQFSTYLPVLKKQTADVKALAKDINGDDAHICALSCRVIFNFSVHGEIRQVVTNAGVLNHLVDCLGFPINASTEEKLSLIVTNAIGAIANLATDAENKSKIATLGGLDPLISAIAAANNTFSESHSMRQHACRALFALSADDKNKIEIVKCNGLRPLIECLQSRSWHVQWHAAGALANISINKKNKVRIAHAGGLEPMIQLAFSERDRVKRQIARGLFALAAHEEVRKLIVDLNGIRALCNLLDSPHEDTQCNSVGALGNIALSSDLKDAVVEGGCLPYVIGLASSTHEKLQRQTARILFSLSAGEAIRRMIVENGGLFPLVRLASSPSEAIQRDAAGAIANIAIGRGNKGKIVEAGGLVPLVELAGSKNSNVQRQVARALFALAGNQENQETIVHLGGLIPLLKLLRSSSSEVRKHAAGAIANIATNANVRAEVVQSGALEPLLQATCSSDINVQKQAVRGLRNLEVRDIFIDSMANEYTRFSTDMLSYVDADEHDSFCDVALELVEADTLIWAHKAVLFARGGNLISDLEDVGETIEVKCGGDITRGVWVYFLQFIYTGVVTDFEKDAKRSFPFAAPLRELSIRYNVPEIETYMKHLEGVANDRKRCKKEFPLLAMFRLDSLFEDCSELSQAACSDIEFVTEDGFAFKLNKIIVCARCPYFRALFESGMRESRQTAVNVPWEGPVFQRIVQYIYTGVAEVDPGVACDMLMASNEWDMPGLQKIVEDDLGKMIDEDSVAMILSATCSVKAPRLRARCIYYALSHFRVEEYESLINHEDFETSLRDELRDKQSSWGFKNQASSNYKK